MSSNLEIYDEEMIKMSNEKNKEELDKLCHKVCLCFGWTLVIFIIIYILCFIYKH